MISPKDCKRRPHSLKSNPPKSRYRHNKACPCYPSPELASERNGEDMPQRRGTAEPHHSKQSTGDGLQEQVLQ